MVELKASLGQVSPEVRGLLERGGIETFSLLYSQKLRTLEDFFAYAFLVIGGDTNLLSEFLTQGSWDWVEELETNAKQRTHFLSIIGDSIDFITERMEINAVYRGELLMVQAELVVLKTSLTTGW